MNRYGYDRKKQDAAAQKIIAGYRDAAAMFPAIRRTAEAFNKKIFNKRFTNALCEATGKKILSRQYGDSIHFYVYEDYEHQNAVLSIKKSELIDGKRIDAEKVLESARCCRAEHLRKAAELEAAAERVDEIKAQVAQLKKMLRYLGDSLPYEALDIWGIDTRCHTW